MQLEDYWGVGPKTSERLVSAYGREGAIEAIESADIRALTDAGVTRGRAIRVLRRAQSDEGMASFGTRDAREVYDALTSLAADYALTAHAADRIRVLTPLPDRPEREARLDRVLAARDAWAALDDDAREAVEAAFAAYDEAGGSERAAVRAALALREAGLRGETFEALDAVDPDALREAADALGAVSVEGRAGGAGSDGPTGALGTDTGEGTLSVARGADEELDRLRDRLADARGLENAALDVLESLRGPEVRSLEDFRGAFVEYVARETELTRGEVRAAMADDARDEADFASTSLRALVSNLEADVEARESTVAAEYREAIERAREDVDAAVAAVDDIAFDLSLARFAAAFDLRRPALRGPDEPLVVAVRGARNLFLDGDVQPIDYAVGDHDPVSDDPDASAADGDSAAASDGSTAGASSPSVGRPGDERVAVLTGANSGGKTTLLETLCQVTVLASMGLPVPAERATVGSFETVVFHRRHASFNAGVLESTLKSIVPPLASGGRTLMLVDEFEAITEPGRAADLLNGLVGLTVDRDALGVYVTHLADELSPLPEAARTDGIFAEGLTDDLQLRVDYQPRFGTVGRSTPEFIVSRLLADSRDRAERQGFEALAAAIGQEAVQRTLSDARFEAAEN